MAKFLKHSLFIALSLALALSLITQAAALEAEQALPSLVAPQDRALYREIFDAQSKQDWARADSAIARLGTPILLGHVLAGRFFGTGL